ncbi:MAG: ImmA/IrrE family metallo-endopeptidase [Acidobacteria bacterium]|nr:ImmA/IrrE family metallo-endopeptidase [Acidobacteriota bacterium]
MAETSIVAPYLPPERLKERADQFLAEHHPAATIPVPIEEIVDLRFQLDIVPTPGLHEHFGVDAFISSDLTTINVDEFVYKTRPGRYRFSLAHEMGHLILNSDIYNKLIFSTIEEWIAAMTNIPEKEYGWLEWQAYEFAGLILVPTDQLRERFQKMAAHLSSVGLSLQTASDAAKHRIAQVIADDFKVSSQAVEKRIQKERLWS